MAGLIKKSPHDIFGKGLMGLSLVFMALGFYMLAWVIFPSPVDTIQINIPAGVLPGAPAGTDYTSFVDYSLEVSWPRWIRTGQGGTLQAALMESAPSELATDHPTQVVIVEPVWVNLSITPPGRLQNNLAPGQNLDLTWSIEGGVAGESTGELYVLFGFFDEGSNTLVPVPVAAIDMSLLVRSFWGMKTNLVIWFSLVSLVLWAALFLLGRWVQVRR